MAQAARGSAGTGARGLRWRSGSSTPRTRWRRRPRTRAAEAIQEALARLGPRQRDRGHGGLAVRVPRLARGAQGDRLGAGGVLPPGRVRRPAGHPSRELPPVPEGAARRAGCSPAAFHYIAGDAADAAGRGETGRGAPGAAIPSTSPSWGSARTATSRSTTLPPTSTTEEPYLVVRLDDACRRQQLGEGWFPALEDVPAEAHLDVDPPDPQGERDPLHRARRAEGQGRARLPGRAGQPGAPGVDPAAAPAYDRCTSTVFLHRVCSGGNETRRDRSYGGIRHEGAGKGPDLWLRDHRRFQRCAGARSRSESRSERPGIHRDDTHLRGRPA